jgi:hypothetical protein
MRYCAHCGTDLPDDMFYRPTGRQCKTCAQKVQAKYRAANSEVRKEYDRQRHYGISQYEYEMLDVGACHICGDDVPLVVDHCHTTGDVRGLICQPCNKALGFARDSIKRLSAMIDYLELDR